jgi:hypothetical protein
MSSLFVGLFTLASGLTLQFFAIFEDKLTPARLALVLIS